MEQKKPPPRTMRQLIAEHPDWADLPIVVSCPGRWGHRSYLGVNCSVVQEWDGIECDLPVLLIFPEDPQTPTND